MAQAFSTALFCLRVASTALFCLRVASSHPPPPVFCGRSGQDMYLLQVGAAVAIFPSDIKGNIDRGCL
jgi:hypothetical protein